MNIFSIFPRSAAEDALRAVISETFSAFPMAFFLSCLRMIDGRAARGCGGFMYGGRNTVYKELLCELSDKNALDLSQRFHYIIKKRILQDFAFHMCDLR